MSTTSSDFGSVQSAATHDVAMQRIDQLKQMVEDGVMKKSDLPPMIKAIYLGCAARSSGSSPSTPESKNITQVLQTSRSFRRAASPETRKIRQMIEAPIVRRFELQCATPDSVLFGKVPPKRLDEQVFNSACAEPLEQIYIHNAKELAKVPSAKVISVVKWKLRKMRGNLVKHGVAKEGVYHDDGFDWDAASKTAPRKLRVQPTPQRQYVKVSPGKKKRSKRKVIELSSSSDDEETPDEELFSPLPRSPKSAFKSPSPTNGKRTCGKCGLLSAPYPLDMDWTSNTSAVPYCKKCFDKLERQCEELALKPQEKRRKKSAVNATKKKVCIIIIFDVFVVLSVLFQYLYLHPSC